MLRTAALALAAGLALVSFASADEPKKADRNVGHFNKKLKPGDAAPDFKDLEGVDGHKHALAEYVDKEVVVLVITCNQCPVAQAYQDRIIDFTKKYAQAPDSKVAVVAINVDAAPEESLEKMKERAQQAGFNFPYLSDASQHSGRQLGATTTPEFFVLSKERKVVYLGAMDNASGRGKYQDQTVNYLEPAVQAALKGQLPEIQETRPHGCTVVYAKQPQGEQK
jgi:peroxiredoxin